MLAGCVPRGGAARERVRAGAPAALARSAAGKLFHLGAVSVWGGAWGGGVRVQATGAGAGLKALRMWARE
jgi:hypothetical protein